MAKDMKDIFDSVVEYREKMQKIVYIADDQYVINVKYEYNIPRSKCSTKEELLDWVAHLTEKTWMTVEVMRYFMQVVSADRELKLSF